MYIFNKQFCNGQWFCQVEAYTEIENKQLKKEK